MLRQITLTIRDPINPFRDLALKYNCRIRVIECKDLLHKVALVLEIQGSHGMVDESFLKDLKSMRYIRHAYFAESPRKGRILALIIMEAPVYCKVARSSGVICSSCPFNSLDDFQCDWNLLVADANALRRSLDMLKESGIKAETKDVSSAARRNVLTNRQRELILAAFDAGYFEFPRKISLSELAEKLSVRPSTLSEILRRAEEKMIRNFAENYKSLL
jgi:hypothetical protein